MGCGKAIGAGLGFMVGGPVGAAVGYGVGGAVGGNKAKAPDTPTYQKQMEEALEAQEAVMPRAYALEQYWQPKWDELNLERMNRYLGTDGQPGMLDTYAAMGSRLGTISSDIDSAQRARDIGDVSALGPQAYEAMRGWNPQQTELMDELNRQALEQAELGGRMTPDQMRMIQNSVMGQRSNMGWGYNPGDMAQAAMQARGYSDQLQQSRMRQAQLQAGQNQSVYGDPFLQILGRQGQTFSALPQGMASAGQGMQSSGPSVFNPESQMAYDLWNTGYQGRLGASIANANNQTAMVGAALGAVGQMGGAGIGAAAMCWVAREIYGETDARWLRFRRWVCLASPGWFYRLYRDHGQQFAGWLRRGGWLQRRLRPIIRRWMDGRIRSVNTMKEVAHV